MNIHQHRGQHENEIEGSMKMTQLQKEIFSENTQLYHCFPGGNDTFLVVNSDIERSSYARIDALIKERYPYFEQGAILERAASPAAVLRMQMAGGEFCGNATRSVAALIASSFECESEEIGVADYAKIQRIDGGLHFLVEVSGTDELIEAIVTKDSNGWQVAIELPAMNNTRVSNDVSISLNGKEVNCSLVELEGIAHILIPSGEFPFVHSQALFETLVSDVLVQSHLGGYPAFGLIWCSETQEGMKIDPVVYVASLKSCIYESACGSGTIALALREAQAGSKSEVKVEQPSGVSLSALIDKTGEHAGMVKAALSGPVLIRGDLNRINQPN